MVATRVFIHGLESTSRGTKGEYFRNKFPDMLLDDFTGPLEHRMDKLSRLLQHRAGLVLVGSSYGGLMASIYTCLNPQAVEKIVLLAPALNLAAFQPFLDRRIDIPAVLYHGIFDDVVDPPAVEKIARQVFVKLQYHAMDDDHSLHRTFSSLPWDELLSV